MSKRIIGVVIFLVILVIVFSFSFLGFEKIKRWIELQVTGRLRVPGVSPQVTAVYLENNYCDEPGGANKPSVIPVANSYRPITFNVTVYDVNGDCGGGITLYICSNESALPNPPYCNAAYSVDSVSNSTPAIKYGPEECQNCYCNYTATYNLPYYMKCGTWYVNVTASDEEGNKNSTVRWWHDSMLLSVWYPYIEGDGEGNEVYLGVVNVGQWNYGMGQNLTKNTGNINVTTLLWNATNFTSGDNVIPIIPYEGNTTFAVDDDTDPMNGAGWINETPTVQIAYPPYGLYRCTDFACSNPRAKYYLWWHIYVPSVPSGEYTNTIQFNASTTMSCD